jgi:hypothetical protein
MLLNDHGFNLEFLVEIHPSMAVKAHEKSVEMVSMVSPDVPDISRAIRACPQILVNLVGKRIKFNHQGKSSSR